MHHVRPRAWIDKLCSWSVSVFDKHASKFLNLDLRYMVVVYLLAAFSKSIRSIEKTVTIFCTSDKAPVRFEAGA